MKISQYFGIALVIISASHVIAQQTPTSFPRSATLSTQPGTTPPAPALTRFDLDFPGGTPHDLVAAIKYATGKPLNFVISDSAARDVKIPALKMKNVDVRQLFSAITGATAKNAFPGNFSIGIAPRYTLYTFKPTEEPANDDSIWVFEVEETVMPVGSNYELRGEPLTPEKEQVSRFYLLTPYLDKGLSVDDITTAIQTGWSMLPLDATESRPQISFHKETKLLIAVGSQKKLEMIDQVLKALDKAPYPVPDMEHLSHPDQKPAKAADDKSSHSKP